MHAAQAESLTDSMKMFQSGLEFGNPGLGKVGVAPEVVSQGAMAMPYGLILSRWMMPFSCGGWRRRSRGCCDLYCG